MTADWLPQTDAMAAWACYFRFFCSETPIRSFAGGGGFTGDRSVLLTPEIVVVEHGFMRPSPSAPLTGLRRPPSAVPVTCGTSGGH